MDGTRYSYFLFGLGMGLAAGLVCAPNSGIRTRRMISSRLREGQDLVKQRSSELKNAVTERLERGKQAAKVATDGVADALQSGKRVLMQS